MAESEAVKTIGVLTSGGDCAGLNAVIRAVFTGPLKGMAGAFWVSMMVPKV